jgi:hypothetical protein
VSLNDRDRKIVAILAPLVLLAAYWFFVLAPKRDESAKVTTQLTDAQGKRDTAQAQVGQLNAAKASFADDYATVIRLGKAIPNSVDMPSLLVQLDRAARGTGVQIKDITVGAPTGGSGGSGGDAAAAGPAGASGASGADAKPADAGGEKAQSAPGKTAEGAGNAVNQANSSSEQSAGASPGGAAGDAAGGSSSGRGTSAAGLSSIGLQFQIRGSFFDLADFFHRMKRFVRVVNDDVVIRGRLISLDSFSFQTGDDGQLKAEVAATVYTSPKESGGVDAGATPGGPSAGGPAAAGQAAGAGQPAADPASSSPTPTASATP